MTTSIAKREMPCGDPARPDRDPAAGRGALFVAVVHGVDGVRVAVAAESRRELVRQLAEYVRDRAEYVLSPAHARYLRTLLAGGEFEATVEVYFGLVGERWDEEWLVTAAVAGAGYEGVEALVGAIAPPADPVRSRKASLGRDVIKNVTIGLALS